MISVQEQAERLAEAMPHIQKQNDNISVGQRGGDIAFDGESIFSKSIGIMFVNDD